jgi:acyl phosphate:glycerol-3-phosphate acyltransferase
VEQIVRAVLIGYILGSIPTAFLAVRWQSKLDIRTAGSGNVGALNSFEVTRSRTVGIVVLLVDLCKGILVVFLSARVFRDGTGTQMVAALAAVAGHNYPVWMRFKGGRGLATAAGACLLIFWGLVPAWCLLWGAGFLVLRSVNPASAVACVLSATLVFIAPTLLPGSPDVQGVPVSWFVAALMVLILFRLIGPVTSFVQEKNKLRSAV